MNAGELLRETRLARGLGQAELARRAGTTQNYISRIERGTVSPSLKTLQRLVHAMGQRMTLTTEPLPPGNVSAGELRADLNELTAAERVEQAMQLSEFLVEVADAAARRQAEQVVHGPR
jgi:transcriptional regulator with XRE-family HTH domain